MTNFLVSRFIRNHDKVNDPKVRAQYGTLSSVVGIVCNLLLFFVKLALGVLSGSIAVTADAFNNLSDVGSALVTFLGFKMASKPADKEHPYGHGRMEYISGLIIAFFILLVGFEFVKTSVEKILHPQPLEFGWIVVAGLVASILVKLWMSIFHKNLGKRLSSMTMQATATDSISDVLSTTVTLIAVVAARFTDLPLDGYMGLVVSLLVLFAGYQVAKDTLSPLLGHAPDPALVARIKDLVLSFDGILGVHDLIVHDYGPGRIFASLHAEVSITQDILASHALIDQIESALDEALGIEVVIHMDPRDTECELTEELRVMVGRVVAEINPSYSIHDFRVILSGQFQNLVFDVTVPIEDRASNHEIIEQITEKIHEKSRRYHPKIVVDRLF